VDREELQQRSARRIERYPALQSLEDLPVNGECTLGEQRWPRQQFFPADA
jgi:hypothetical protein